MRGQWLEALRGALAEEGLGPIGVVSQARYDAAAPPALAAERLWPGTRSIVVVGSGGRAHWARFLAYVAEDPEGRLARRSHPLDDFCKVVLTRCHERIAECRIIYPTFDEPIRLDFVRLGELAGLGRPSELGILVSERFGPWLGLRAALFCPRELAETPVSRRMCEGCPAPCLAACPPGWGGPGPFAWARRACIVAPEQAYDALEELYHTDPMGAGRRALLGHFGL